MTTYTNEQLCSLDATALLAGYAQQAFTPLQVMHAVLERTERLNPIVNAFYYVDAAGALACAEASTQRWQAGKPQGLLDGVPVSIKDSIGVQGTPQRVGSVAVHVISPADAPPAARLREAGALLFAKTTMPDHGMFGAGVSTAHGVTRNPWNTAFNTGGSSSGAGAALGARLGPLSIGTDIAGSVRLPASACGLSSLKPTHGVVAHLPVVAVREAGPMARSARDVALGLRVLSGPDARDFGSVPAQALSAPAWTCVQGLRIGVLLDMGYGDAPEPAVVAAVQQAAAVFERLGAQVQVMGPLLDKDPLPSLAKLYALPQLARFNGMTEEQRAKSYGPLLEFAETARTMTALEHMAAIQAVDNAKVAVNQAIGAFDYVLAPVMTVVNWAAEKNAPNDDDIYRMTSFCGMFNQTGQPVGCVCAGQDARGLPIGLQIVGQRFDDLGVLQLAEMYEKERAFALDWPAVA